MTFSYNGILENVTFYYSLFFFMNTVMGRTNNGKRNKQMERIDYVIHLITTKNNNEASNPFRKRLITFH